MDAKLLAGMNEHLKLEFKASHEYLAMSVWLSVHDLPGFATWMRQQSADELIHAQKFIDHMVERDQQVLLPAVAQPPMQWDSVEALCTHVLQIEQAVSASINELYAMAEGARDRPAIVLLHGCGGPYGPQRQLSERMNEHARLFNGQGWHVLVPDSLTPRGERELCTQREGTRAVTQTQRRRDALPSRTAAPNGTRRWPTPRTARFVKSGARPRTVP